MRAGQILTVAFAVCVAQAAAAGAQVPGTYRLTICASPCTESDSGVVRGTLVLFRDAFFIDTLPASTRKALARDLYLGRPRSPLANGCFSLVRSQNNVNGRELYAGIIARSVMNWSSGENGTYVPLYRSPDAAYTLSGTFEGDVYSGEGVQGFCCGIASPRSFFRAVRVGDAELGRCL